ncbi:MAG: hypothetical protein WCA49_23170 [Candidatus Sulfotelmatobacter sp.]
MAKSGQSSAKAVIIAVFALLGAIILGTLLFLSDLGGALGGSRR